MENTEPAPKVDLPAEAKQPDTPIDKWSEVAMEQAKLEARLAQGQPTSENPVRFGIEDTIENVSFSQIPGEKLKGITAGFYYDNKGEKINIIALSKESAQLAGMSEMMVPESIIRGKPEYTTIGAEAESTPALTEEQEELADEAIELATGIEDPSSIQDAAEAARRSMGIRKLERTEIDALSDAAEAQFDSSEIAEETIDRVEVPVAAPAVEQVIEPIEIPRPQVSELPTEPELTVETMDVEADAVAEQPVETEAAVEAVPAEVPDSVESLEEVESAAETIEGDDLEALKLNYERRVDGIIEEATSRGRSDTSFISDAVGESVTRLRTAQREIGDSADLLRRIASRVEGDSNELGYARRALGEVSELLHTNNRRIQSITEATENAQKRALHGANALRDSAGELGQNDVRVGERFAELSPDTVSDGIETPELTAADSIKTLGESSDAMERVATALRKSVDTNSEYTTRVRKAVGMIDNMLQDASRGRMDTDIVRQLARQLTDLAEDNQATRSLGTIGEDVNQLKRSIVTINQK